jgi:hypothetical protein
LGKGHDSGASATTGFAAGEAEADPTEVDGALATTDGVGRGEVGCGCELDAATTGGATGTDAVVEGDVDGEVDGTEGVVAPTGR